MVEEIKRFDNFILQYVTDVGVKDTPYEELAVKSIGLADKHVIEVRLDCLSRNFDGTPVKDQYYRVYVSHGMRMKQDTLKDTKEYIDTLNEALDVAFEVQKYCILNGWWHDKR